MRVTGWHRVAWGVSALLLVTGASTPAGAQPDLRLVAAARARTPALVDRLVRQGVDVNAARADGATALLWAAHWDDHATAERLIAAGADVDAAEDQGVTPLSRACENASHAMVSRLLAAGADPNAAQANGVTPLMTAARTGNPAVVRALLDVGAVVDARIVATGQTALMWATAEAHHAVMAALIDAGADVGVASHLGFTALLFAARNGDLEGGRRLVAAGADVDQAGSDGTTAVALALVSGQAEFARFLLAEGADPNGTIHGVSALHAAAGGVDLWIRDWLRRRRISVGLAARTTQGLAARERLPMVETLLGHGADPNPRAAVSTTVEAWVSGRNGAREAQAVGTGNLRGATPLWVAAYRANRPPRVRADLPEEGVDLSDGGDTARIVRALLDAGADPTLASADGTTPLMVAAGLGHATARRSTRQSPPSPSAEAVVRMLVEAGADVNAANEAGFTALHGAAFRGLNEVVSYLVARGADIDAQDFRGRTAYRITEGAPQGFFVQEWPGTAALLVSLGADTTLGQGGRERERELGRQRTEGAPRGRTR